MNRRGSAGGRFPLFGGRPYKRMERKLGPRKWFPLERGFRCSGVRCWGGPLYYIYIIYCFIFPIYTEPFVEMAKFAHLFGSDDGELEILSTLDKIATAAVSERKRRSREKSCFIKSSIFAPDSFHRNTSDIWPVYPTGNVLQELRIWSTSHELAVKGETIHYMDTVQWH